MKSATLVAAGALAVALNVVPSTTAMADASHRSGADSAVALQGAHKSARYPWVPGHDHYVRSANGTATAIAQCNLGDVATGGGYQTSSGFGVSQNRPVNVLGPYGFVNAWQATLEMGQTGPITVYVVCESA